MDKKMLVQSIIISICSRILFNQNDYFYSLIAGFTALVVYLYSVGLIEKYLNLFFNQKLYKQKE